METARKIVNSSNGVLVIFDLDGTLFQARQVTIPAVQETFAANGLPIPDADAIGAYIGRPAKEYHDWLAAYCSPDRVHEIIAETDRRELELIGTAGRLFPGVPEMLASLQGSGFHLAMSSNAPEDYFAETLDTQNLRRFFQPALCRGTRFSSKTEIVKTILREAQGRAFAVVGDRHDDIESARAFGGFAVAVTYGFGTPDELAGADALVDSPAAVIEALKTLLPNSNAAR
jgi:phosphoglycolate phosphatase-like HAD superfamily hydrolase